MKRALSRKNLWEGLHSAVKASIGRTLGLLPPARLLGRRFRKNLAFAREAERWSAERARAYQLAAVRRICSLAFAKTDYYRRRFDEAGFYPDDLRSLDDLSRLPTIDKTTVLENLDQYSQVGDVEFLQMLCQEGLFAKESDDGR